MTLNGIDVSSYQAGINIRAIPADFVIVKVTEGTGYVNPAWRAQADGTLDSGKLLGLYHYVDGGNPRSEARYFVGQIKGYLGRALLAIDWESGGNRAWGNIAYLESVAREVIRLTGIRPLLYGSATVYRQLSDVARRLNCGLWIAQYASTNPTGYQARPWNEGAYGCAIRQYADNGRLYGWNGGLDLDKFYGDRNMWAQYAHGKAVKEMSAQDVWNYGLGHDGKSGNKNMPAWQYLSFVHEDTLDVKQQLLRTDDGGTKDGTRGGMFSRVCYMDMRIRKMEPIITSLGQEVSDLKATIKELEGKIASLQGGQPVNGNATVSGTFQVKEVNNGNK